MIGFFFQTSNVCDEGFSKSHFSFFYIVEFFNGDVLKPQCYISVVLKEWFDILSKLLLPLTIEKSKVILCIALVINLGQLKRYSCKVTDTGTGSHSCFRSTHSLTPLDARISSIVFLLNVAR